MKVKLWEYIRILIFLHGANQMTFPYCHIKYRFKVKWSSQSFTSLKSDFFCNYDVYIWFFGIYLLRIEETDILFGNCFLIAFVYFCICGVPGPCSNDFFFTIKYM